ncbi:MAG: alcohol dehydrogenase catalytic domain-containing protein [Azospirillaceae bacterium]
MRSALLTAYDQPFALVDRPVPEPGPGEVVVAVSACGVCGSDRFLQKGGFGGPLPIVPGHEAAGRVAAIGDGVAGLAIGQKVALYYIAHCGQCRYCLAGRENICLEVRRMGVDFDGAMAELVRLPAENCLPLDDAIDLAAAAVITDAIGTPTHALGQARVGEGDRVLVMGVGGIGSNAVQIARVLGCTVIAASRSDSALANATALGAQAALRADDDLPAAVRELTGGLGVDAVIQCAPAAAAYSLALDCLAKGGRLVIVGTSEAPVPIALNPVLWAEHEILGSRGFTRADIRRGLDWYRSGAIAVDHLVRHRRPLEQINEAIADLDNPDVVRTVIELA